MLSNSFAPCLELLDKLTAVFNGLLQLAFAGLVGLDFFWLQLLGQLDLGKLDYLTAEQPVLTPDLTIELAPSRADDASCISNSFDTILGQAVQIVVLVHITERFSWHHLANIGAATRLRSER